MSVRSQYFAFYNALCFLLWIVIALQLLPVFVSGFTTGSLYGWSQSAPLAVRVALTLALCEILHSVLGLVKSSPMTTAMQVFSRLHVVYIVWVYAPTTIDSYFSLMTIFAWTVSELIRYPYYILTSSSNMSGAIMSTMKWLRYSAFYVLYPVGISGEVGCMAKAVIYWLLHPQAKASLGLANSICLAVSYMAVILIYAPGSVHMMGHMVKQRQRVYGGATGGSTGGSTGVRGKKKVA